MVLGATNKIFNFNKTAPGNLATDAHNHASGGALTISDAPFAYAQGNQTDNETLATD
jgi:hypothetical protein